MEVAGATPITDLVECPTCGIVMHKDDAPDSVKAQSFEQWAERNGIYPVALKGPGEKDDYDIAKQAWDAARGAGEVQQFAATALPRTQTCCIGTHGTPFGLIAAKDEGQIQAGWYLDGLKP